MRTTLTLDEDVAEVSEVHGHAVEPAFKPGEESLHPLMGGIFVGDNILGRRPAPAEIGAGSVLEGLV